MPLQLSLFGEENTLFNTGVQRLLEMDFAGCVETLGRYQRFFPGGRNVGREVEAAAFLGEKLGQVVWTSIDPAEAERRYRVWLEFEAAFGWPWKRDSIEERLQVRYFSMLTDGLAVGAHSDMTELPGGTPVGLLYLLARRPDEAMVSLKALIGAAKENARAWGYLGDVHFLRGDVRQARICYREAFAMAPGQVDVRRILDKELKEQLEDLRVDEELDGNYLDWFPVVARLDGIFESRSFRDLDELNRWLKHYRELLEDHRKREDRASIPGLFYHAMALSDNAGMIKYVKRVDLPEIRRKMKEWQPYLFARYMKMLELKK
ncbi:MAG: hypothetical protein JRG73_08410 [Deltaproteobacteria bacterium]|nr:hypothetical protein [Deltaproteobacteria bacterium]